MDNFQNNCLLTVVVVTYNSSKFVSETLNSISNQNSKDIQIILADDCSTDSTLKILEGWKNQNEDLFSEIILLESKENSGVVKNFTRTFQFSTGIWIKAIAGDDLFDKEAFQFMRNDIDIFSNSSVIVGKAKIFGDSIAKGVIIPRNEVISKLKTINQTKNYLLEGYTFPGVSFLIRTKILKENNLFKQAKKNFEDVPFQLELLLLGFKFEHSEYIYIHYRKHENNLSNLNSGILPRNFLDYHTILLYYSFKSYKINYILNSLWNLLFGNFIFLVGNKSRFCFWMNKLRKYLQPKRFFRLFFKPF